MGCSAIAPRPRHRAKRAETGGNLEGGGPKEPAPAPRAGDTGDDKRGRRLRPVTGVVGWREPWVAQRRSWPAASGRAALTPRGGGRRMLIREASKRAAGQPLDGATARESRGTAPAPGRQKGGEQRQRPRLAGAATAEGGAARSRSPARQANGRVAGKGAAERKRRSDRGEGNPRSVVRRPQARGRPRGQRRRGQPPRRRGSEKAEGERGWRPRATHHRDASGGTARRARTQRPPRGRGGRAGSLPTVRQTTGKEPAGQG